MLVIAYLTMIVDHIGILLGNNIFMRLIGRLSFPLFVMGIVRGLNYTHDRLKYVIRLVILAFFSQIPYMVFLHTYRLNVIFTFLFSILALYIYKYDIWLFFLYLIIVHFVSFDYGLYGILLFMVLSLYDGYLMYFFVILLNLIYVFFTFDILQFFSLFSMFLFSIKDIKINRYLKYSIYPLQFILLEVLRIWIVHKY
jgi:hypothetical protein